MVLDAATAPLEENLTKTRSSQGPQGPAGEQLQSQEERAVLVWTRARIATPPSLNAANPLTSLAEKVQSEPREVMSEEEIREIWTTLEESAYATKMAEEDDAV